MKIHCPTCSKPFDPAETDAMPFCCRRCRLIDLGRWFNEQFGLPWEGDDDQDVPQASPPDRYQF